MIEIRYYVLEVRRVISNHKNLDSMGGHHDWIRHEIRVPLKKKNGQGAGFFTYPKVYKACLGWVLGPGLK